jgi:hypothetical protein
MPRPSADAKGKAHSSARPGGSRRVAHRSCGGTLPILILDRRPYLLAAWRIGEALAIWECAGRRKMTKIRERGHRAGRRRLSCNQGTPPFLPLLRSASCSFIATVSRPSWGGNAGTFRPARNMRSTPFACTAFGRDRSWRLRDCAAADRSEAMAMIPCHTRFRIRRAGGFRCATACGTARARGTEAMWAPSRRGDLSSFVFRSHMAKSGSSAKADLSGARP